MAREHDEQMIALAGMFQCAALVEQLAKRGLITQDSFESSIASLFVTDPQCTEDVFGGVRDLPYNLGTGLRTLRDIADKKPSALSPDVTRYVLNLIQLERKLSNQPQLLEKLDRGFDQILSKASYFSEVPVDELRQPFTNPGAFTHPNVVAAIASLYQETVSTLTPRIQVGGDPRHLQNSENAARIRALLMAGVRATILWRQVGGRRWHMFLLRSRIAPSIKKIRSQL